MALQPAAAQSIATLAALVTCSSSSPCASWQNKGTGIGIQATTARGEAVRGITSGQAQSGVYGQSVNKNGGYGVHGDNSVANGIAVYATGGPGTGIVTSGNLFGLYSVTSGTGLGIVSQSDAGIALDAFSGSNYGALVGSDQNIGLFADSYGATSHALEADDYGTSSAMFGADGAHISGSTGNGAVIANGAYTANGINAIVGNASVRWGAIVGGKQFGLIATTGAGTSGYPLEAYSANSSGTITGGFFVDGKGDIYYTGGIVSFARTRGGSNVTAYETKSTQANVEDSGTAQLVAGSAVVQLDPAFAQSIDLSTPYRVFLTPNGDTRGLYIAQKSAAGFVVRETQGGRGTFSFDYRILASAAGHVGERMTAITPAVVAKTFPMLGGHAGNGSYTGMTAVPAAPKVPGTH